jgi:ABC-type branched-subunit amino acid transport system ATPase component
VRRRNAARAATQAVLDQFDLTDIAHLDSGTLSFGQLRILEIARAYATAPKILLLDEPAAGLNAHEVNRLERLIRAIHASGVGVVVIDHDVPFVFGLCDVVVVVDFGRLIAEGAPEDVRSNREVRSAYLGEEVAAN